VATVGELLMVVVMAFVRYYSDVKRDAMKFQPDDGKRTTLRMPGLLLVLQY